MFKGPVMLSNTQRRYGLIAIALHWVSALAVFGLFGLGWWMIDLDYYSTWYRQAPDLHKSIGLLLAAATVLRLLWKWRQPAVIIDGLAAREHQLAKIGQAVLYLLLLIILASGYLIATGDARPIAVFNGFELPALPWQFANQADIAGSVHKYAAWALVILAAGHGLLALKHHFFNRDHSLNAMLGRD